MRAVWVLIAVGLSVAALSADVIYVSTDAGDDAWTGLCETYDGDLCGPKKTIAAAMSAAADGDEVVLAMGVYKGDGNRDLDFAGKAITVRSSQPDDADVVAATVIDCEGTAKSRHRAFRLISKEQGASVLDGLTIRNGYAPVDTEYDGNTMPVGGAVLCDGASPTIRSCVFLQCTALLGGALFIRSSNAAVSACRFADNAVVEYDRGGSSWVGSGGAVIFDHCVIDLRDSVFERNRADYAAGALSCDLSRGTVSGCTFNANSADSDLFAARGGAVACFGANDTVLEQCRFSDNKLSRKSGRGVAVSILVCSVRIRDCSFVSNVGLADNGVVHALRNSSVEVMNCAFTGNSARSVRIDASGIGAVGNSIIWKNEKPALDGSGELSVSFSDVEGGWNGTGNVNVDPKFVAIEQGNLRLMDSSPCIDTGDSEAGSPPGDVDLDGRRRVWNGRIDMGAYEFGSFSYGDVNCDGVIATDDIDPFVAALIGQETYDEAMPECDWLNADVDGDGTVSFADIDPFVLLLIGE